MKKTYLFFFLSILVSTGFAQNRSDTIHVVHYDLQLSVLDFVNRHIDGCAQLQVVSKISNLASINLDFYGLTVDSVFVNQSKITDFTHQSQLLQIPVTGISAFDTVQVTVYYQGVPERDPSWGGFYFSGEYAYNIGVAMTDVPHNYGRVWYPCIDDFIDKSTYTLHVTTQYNKRAVCGGLLTDSLTLADSTKIWTWELSQPIPSYLTSVAVGDYQLYADTFHGINGVCPIQIYMPPNYYANTAATFANLKSIIHHYEACFGPHRWGKVGYVGVNFNGGAMEHATNIAYPLFAVTATNAYESLYAHELAHSWFGNLLTCKNAEEMWINEGFASYCEAVTNEFLYPDSNPELDGYKTTIRDLQHTVLKSTHTQDGAYYALNQVPLSVTYGSTSYDKGALVVHTLRQYLGDSLFFRGCQSLLQSHAYQSITSEELFQYLSQTTGVNLSDFYEGWVNQPGFLHFSIDSIVPTSQSSTYQVYVRQRLHHALHFANSNRVDLSFVSSDNEIYTYPNFEFSGEFGVTTVVLPFEPVFGIVDIDDKLGDAIFDYTKTVNQSGLLSFSNANFTINTESIEQPVWIRVEHNMVAPDALQTVNPNIYRISDVHYWRVAFNQSNNWEGLFQFKYQMASSSQWDYALAQGYSKDDLVLLYRSHCGEDWQIIDFTLSGNSYSGSLKTSQLLPGEYALGVGNKSSKLSDDQANDIAIFPNPTRNTVHIKTDIPLDRFELLDSMGNVLESNNLNNRNINLKSYSSGLYFIRLFQNNRIIRIFKINKL